MNKLRDSLARTLMAGLALCVVMPALAAPGGNKNKADGRSVLVRTPDALDADAKGRIDFEVKKGEYKLKIKARKLTGIALVDFVLLDEEGDEDEVIRSAVAVETDDDGDGTAKITLRSRDEELLVDGTEVDGDLEGRLVGVRTAGAEDVDLLWGRIPDLDNDSGKKKIKPKKEMFGTVEGSQVRFEWREKDGRIRIKLKVPFDGLVEGDSVGFLLYPGGIDEDPVVLGFATVDEDGKVKLKLRTDHGDPVPLDLMENVDDLSGMAVRVFHDANDNGEYDDGEPKHDGNLPTFSR